jgi:hypothetical protein
LAHCIDAKDGKQVNCDSLKIALAKNLQAPGINGHDA